MEYIITQDEDCHWYVIPDNKQKEFNAWVATAGEEEQPEWVEMVGGAPLLVKFKEYRIA